MDPSKEPDGRHYYAEWMLHKMGFEHHVSDPQQYIDDVLDEQWFANRWYGVHELEITYWPAATDAYAGAQWWNLRIKVPPAMCSDFTLLHELAHFCAPPKTWGRAWGGTDLINHGPDFVQVELELVRRHMGYESYNCLRHALMSVGLL